MIANRIASLPRIKGGLVKRRWLHFTARSRASFDKAHASFSRPKSILMPSDRSRWATDASSRGRDAFNGAVVVTDRGVQEMIAIEAAQVAHEIGKNSLALLAGLAGANDEVGLREPIIAFQNSQEGTRFRRKALAGRLVEHRSQRFSVAGRKAA